MTEEQLREELDQWEDVRYRMEAEGIEYCFRSYYSFQEIEDDDFHLKRERLIEMMVEMEEYIQEKITEVEDQIIEIHNEED